MIAARTGIAPSVLLAEDEQTLVTLIGVLAEMSERS